MRENKANIIYLQRKERIMRINQLKEILEKAFKKGVEVDKDKFIGVCCLDYGLSRRTVLEYLSVLKSVMGFTIERKVLRPLK